MTIRQGDDELDRVLRQSFKGIPPKERKELGEIVSSEINNEGLSPGTTYQGGPQSQARGLAGKKATRAVSKWDALLHGIDPSKCGPLSNPDCLELNSRFLEQTFRNFQMAARRPSHIDAPFRATLIDQGVPAQVVLPAGAPGAFTTVVSVTIPAGRFRAVISALGHSTRVVGDWENIEWRILVDGIPWDPYRAIFHQMWLMVPPTKLESPIKLRGGQVVTMEARAEVGGPYDVMGRMAGWFYPVRSEDGGDSIRSTLVD